MDRYDVSIERKGSSKLYFNLCDYLGRPSRAKGSFSMAQFSSMAIKMQQGETDHSDREPPYASSEQSDFSGGRGWDRFEKDRTRFYDSYRAQTWRDDLVALGPEERYASGIRLGEDVVTNGTFDADSDWSKDAGWSIAAGVASCDGSQVIPASIYQTCLTVGLTYRIIFTISNYVDGTLTPYCGNSQAGTARSANGTYTEYLTCSGNTVLYLRGNADFTADVDNVKVEVYGASYENWWDDNPDAEDDLVRQVLSEVAEMEYFSYRFTPSVGFTPKYVQLALGCEYENSDYNLTISIYSDAAGEPDTSLMTTGSKQPDVYEHIERFEFTSPVALYAGTYYHLVVRNYQPTGTSTDLGYYLICHASAADDTVYYSSDGSTWLEQTTPRGICFRLMADDGEFDMHPFEHLGALYVALSFRDGSDPRIYRNGERGKATSATSTTLVDSGASFTVDALIGGIVVLYSGLGSDVDRPWRLITDNDGTSITVDSAWDETPDETTRYCVIQNDIFTEVTGHGMTGRITDVYTFGNIVYFCRGDFLDLYHMYDDSFSMETGNRGTFIIAGPDSAESTTKIYLARASYPPAIMTADPEFADDNWTVQDLDFDQAIDVGDASFELNDASWADVGTPTTSARDAAPVKDGVYAWNVITDAIGEGITQTITVETGSRYRIEAWIYQFASIPPEVSYEVGLYFDGDLVAEVDTTGSWIHMYGYNTASGDSVTLQIKSISAVTNWNVDAVKVTKVDTLLPSGHSKITGLVVAGNPKRLFVMTDTGILKESSGNFLDVSPGEFQNVRDYRNGAVSNNKGDYIYTTFLNEVIKYYDEEIAVLGPNMDMGMPADRRGEIRSMVTYGDWLLAAVDGGVDNYSSIVLYNGVGWHEYYRAPAVGMRITSLFIQSIPGDYLDRLWFNEGADIAWLGIDRRPEMNANYRYTFSGWVDLATIYGSMGEVEKFFQSIKVTADSLASTHYLSVAPRDPGGYSSGGTVPAGETYETLWGALTTSPADENTIDEFYSMEDFTMSRIQIHLGLHNTRPTLSPDLRSIVVDYIEHVPVKWTYTLRLVTADSRESLTGERANDAIEDDLSTLMGYVNSAEPVRVTTPFSYANPVLVKLTSITDVEPVGYTRRNDRERSMFVLSAVDV